MTAPGTLNRRLVLEEPVETPDGSGGVTRGFQTLATLWAEVTPVSARGDIVAEARGATVTHRIVIRRNADVTTRYRFRDGTRIFAIVSIRERDRGRFLDIHAEERRD
jgi:SPP1 family predicted phage head-tail adaptor